MYFAVSETERSNAVNTGMFHVEHSKYFVLEFGFILLQTYGQR